MSFLTFCQWIETTSLSIAIREGALYYPILGALHLAAIAWFGVTVLIGDLRILGIGVSGGLLWWAEPVVCYHSPRFMIKIVLLLLVGLNSLILRNKVYRNIAGGNSRGARLAACASMLLWLALIFTGRGIAFF